MNNSEPPNRKITLKDQDFYEIEKTIKISTENATETSILLCSDADFFKSCKLMDYSLLVMIIDVKNYAINSSITEAQAI